MGLHEEKASTPRAIRALADGKLMVSGYANTTIGGGVGPQPMLYKLNANGTLDTTWNETTGIFHESVLAVQTEVYSIAIHDDGTFTTAGYGRNAGTLNDYASMKFAITTAGNAPARDLTFGNGGIAFFDPSGALLGSNCRHAVALPGGKTALTGSTGPSTMPIQNAVVALLDETGALDTAYDTGVHVFELGQNGNDQFWGGTVSGDNLIVVGYQGGLAAPQTEAFNDDSYVVVFPIQD